MPRNRKKLLDTVQRHAQQPPAGKGALTPPAPGQGAQRPPRFTTNAPRPLTRPRGTTAGGNQTPAWPNRPSPAATSGPKGPPTLQVRTPTWVTNQANPDYPWSGPRGAPAAPTQPGALTQPNTGPTADEYYQPGGEKSQYQGLSAGPQFELSLTQMERWQEIKSPDFEAQGGQERLDQMRAARTPALTTDEIPGALPAEQQGQQFGLAPGDPATTMRGKLAGLMGAPIPFTDGTVGQAVTAGMLGISAARLGFMVGGPYGALALSIPAAMAAWQSGRTDFDQNSTTGRIMRALNVPFMQAAKLYGLLEQLRMARTGEFDDINTILSNLKTDGTYTAGDTINDELNPNFQVNDPAQLAANAAKYGTYADIFGSWEKLRAAFEASGDELLYRAYNADPRLLTQAPNILKAGAGELLGIAEWARAGDELGPIPFGDDTQVFVDYDLPTINGGAMALVEARQRILNPSAQDVAAAQALGLSVEQFIRLEIASRFGAGAEIRTLGAGLTALDPLDAAPGLMTGLVSRVARLAGATDVARAAALTQGPTSFAQAYRNILVTKEMPAFREGYRAAQELNWLQRMIVGKELIKLTETGTWTPPKPWEFWRLTPASAAKESVVQFSNHLQSYLSTLPLDESFPRRAAAFIAQLKRADLDPAALPAELQDAARLSLSFEGRVAQRALDETASADLAAAWEATAPDRQLLSDVAKAAGDTPENILRRLGRGEGEVLLAQLRRAAQAQGDAGAGLLAKLADGTLTAKTLGGLHELFTKGGMPHTLEQVRARLLFQTIEAAGEWSVKAFGVPAEGFKEKLAGALKGIESIALLGLNFTYPLKNFLNGEVSLWARGVWGLRNIIGVREKMRRTGITPARMGAGSGAYDLGLDMAVDGLEAGAFKAVEAAVRGDPTGVSKGLDNVRAAAGRVTSALWPTKIAQKLERAQGARALVAGFEQMWSQVWRRGVGFKKMPPALEAGLRALDPRLPEYIYAAVESGLNAQEIAAKILVDAPRPVVQQFTAAAAARLGVDEGMVARVLGVEGLGDQINAGLAAGADPAVVFARVKEQAQAHLDETAAAELGVQVEHAAATVQTQGPDGLLRVLDTLEERLYDTHLRHTQALEAEWEQVGRQKAWRNVIIAKMRERAAATWARYFKHEAGAYQGLTDGLAAAGLKLDDGFMPALQARQALIAAFHKESQALLDSFFGTKHTDDAARTAAWERVQDQTAALYEQLTADVQRQQLALDDYLTAVIARDSSAAHGQAVAEWRKALREFNAEDMKEVSAFRKTLRTMSADERGAAWRKFNEARLKRRAEMVKVSIEQRRAATASGAVPPVSGGVKPAGARTPAQPGIAPTLAPTPAAIQTPAKATPPTSPEIARLEESLALARAEVKRLKPAVQAESQAGSNVGPAHQAMQMAQKRVKAVSMMLAAERKAAAVGKVEQRPPASLAPDDAGKAAGEISPDLAPKLAEHAAVEEAAAALTLATAGHDPTYAPLTRAQLREQLLSEFKVGEAEADAVLALTDRRAESWAEANGQTPDEWYATRLAGADASQVQAGALNQGARGATWFLDDGRAVIVGLESPNVATLVHELGHVFRRDLSGVDLAHAEAWAEVKDGVWLPPNEEKFARGFERYLADGTAPTPGLVRVFERFKQWLGDIYATAMGWLTGIKIDPEMRGVYDRLLLPTKRTNDFLGPLAGGRVMAEPNLHTPVEVIRDDMTTVRVRLPDGTERNVPRDTIYYAEQGLHPPAKRYDEVITYIADDADLAYQQRRAKHAADSRAFERRQAIARDQDWRAAGFSEAAIRRKGELMRARQAGQEALPLAPQGGEIPNQPPPVEVTPERIASLPPAERVASPPPVDPWDEPVRTWDDELREEMEADRALARAQRAADDPSLPTLKDATQQPRSELPEELSQLLLYVARDLREDILSGAPGGRIFDSSGPGTEVTGYGSSYADWYGPFLEKWSTNKAAVLKALDKIVLDKGYDKGVMVARLKRLGLERLAEGMMGNPPEPEALRLMGRGDAEIEAARRLWSKVQAEQGQAEAGAPDVLYQGGPLPGGVRVGQVIELNGKAWTVEGWSDAAQAYTVVDDAGGRIQVTAEALNAQSPAFMSQAAAQAVGLGDPMPHAQAFEESWHNSMLPVLDALHAALDGGQGETRLKGVGSGGAALDPGLRDGLNGWLKQTYGQMAPARLASVKWGEFTRDAALLNYSRRFQFNAGLGLVAPYEFFMTGSMVKWLLHSFDRPTWLSNYYRLQRTLNTAVTKPGFPSRLAGRVRIPMPFLPDWAGDGMWIDPLNMGLPLEGFMQPWEQAQRAARSQDQQVQRMLDQMLREGELTADEHALALADHESPTWQRAAQLAAVESEDERRFDGLDFASVMASPHLPITWALEAARGTPERIGVLPGTRQIRALTAVLGIGGPGGVNLEADLRRRLGIPVFDEWEDWRIDRALADMAAEGLTTSEQAVAAMIERSGPLFDLAQQRSAEQSGYGTVAGMILGTPGQVLPEGEERQRLLKELLRAAYAAQDEGDTSPMTAFLEKYPEYEARLALDDNKDERLRQFLIDRVWTGWRALPDLYRRQVQDQFGDEFNEAFLSSETRNYDGLDPATLATWARTLGQYVPANAAGQPLPIEWAPAEVARDAQDYYAMRRQVFTDQVRALQTAYFNIPEDERLPVAPPTWVQSYYTQRDTNFPGIRDTLAQYDALWGDARRDFRRAHPEIGNYLDWRAFVKRQRDDFGRYIGGEDEYRGSQSARSAFLDEHPELAAAWDADRAWLDERPWVRPYVKRDNSATEGEGEGGEEEEALRGVEIIGSPEMQRLVTAYLFGGASIPSSARAVLLAAWQAQGKPEGTLEAWLLEVMAFGGNLGVPAGPEYGAPVPVQ